MKHHLCIAAIVVLAFTVGWSLRGYTSLIGRALPAHTMIGGATEICAYYSEKVYPTVVLSAILLGNDNPIGCWALDKLARL